MSKTTPTSPACKYFSSSRIYTDCPSETGGVFVPRAIQVGLPLSIDVAISRCVSSISAAYPASLPSEVHISGEGEESLLDVSRIQESETLRGVHIAGFNYAYEPGCSLRNVDLGDDDMQDSSQLSVINDSKALEGILPKAIDPVGESTYVTPAASIHSSLSGAAALSHTTGSPVLRSAASSSTALYSCTSFGELREALKARPSEKFPLPSSDSDFQVNQADFSTIDRSRRTSKATTALSELALSRPTSILLRQDSELITAGGNICGLGARGLGLRKYASLDFELDTIISLEIDSDRGRKHLGTLQTTQPDGDNISMPKSSATARRVSFLDILASPGDTIVTPSTATLDGTASPWKTLNKYYSPGPGGNKLRKKRTESTPILSATPRLCEKVDLPSGLQQIGLGIGYTYAGITDDSHKDKTIKSPRRALSLGSGVARCGAFLSQIRRPRVDNSHCDAQQPERASEESDAMDAVMREMYGDAWNTEMGVNYYDSGYVASARRSAGRVYSVDADAKEMMGSTLRLIDTPRPRDPIR